MKRFYVVIIISLFGCGASLSEAGRGVKVMKADPPQGCVEVGSVDGSAKGPDHVERAKNAMRNEAAERGANYVRLETLNTEDGEAAGTAYKCPAEK
jgi:hypothetical protein